MAWYYFHGPLTGRGFGDFFHGIPTNEILRILATYRRNRRADSSLVITEWERPDASFSGRRARCTMIYPRVQESAAVPLPPNGPADLERLRWHSISLSEFASEPRLVAAKEPAIEAPLTKNSTTSRRSSKLPRILVCMGLIVLIVGIYSMVEKAFLWVGTEGDPKGRPSHSRPNQDDPTSPSTSLEKEHSLTDDERHAQQFHWLAEKLSGKSLQRNDLNAQGLAILNVIRRNRAVEKLNTREDYFERYLKPNTMSFGKRDIYYATLPKSDYIPPVWNTTGGLRIKNSKTAFDGLVQLLNEIHKRHKSLQTDARFRELRFPFEEVRKPGQEKPMPFQPLVSIDDLDSIGVQTLVRELSWSKFKNRNDRASFKLKDDDDETTMQKKEAKRHEEIEKDKSALDEFAKLPLSNWQ